MIMMFCLILKSLRKYYDSGVYDNMGQVISTSVNTNINNFLNQTKQLFPSLDLVIIAAATITSQNVLPKCVFLM